MLLNKLSPKQEEVAQFAVEVKTCALFCEQRTGKTLITLRILQKIADKLFSGLFIVPLTNKDSTWSAKIASELPHINIATELDEYKALPFPKVLLMHYEGIRDKKLRKKLVKMKWTLILFDESQRIKDRGSLASRVARQLRFCGEYRLLLSGTPIDSQPQDLWAQFRFMNHQIFGERWSEFDEEYLKPTGYMGYQRKFKEEKMPRFLELIKPYTVRLTQEDLGFTPPVYFHEQIEMFGSQKRLYDELEREMIAKINAPARLNVRVDRTGKIRISTPLKVTQIVKLQQIANGFVIDDEEQTHRVGKAKVRRLKSVLTKLDKRDKMPVVIFCKFKEDIAIVKDLLTEMGLTHGILWGKLKDKKNDKARTRLLLRFQKGRYDCLISQVRTGGVGIDLFAAKAMVVYSTTHSLIDFDQLLARAQCFGKTEPVEIYLLGVKKTVDEDISTAILLKRSVSDNVLNSMKRNTVMPKDEKVKETKSKEAKVEKAAKEPAPEFKYGVTDLAKKLGIKDASVRVQLRQKGIKKAGKSYGWNTREELDSVVTKLQAAPKEKTEKAKSEKKSSDKGEKKTKEAA